MEANRGQTATPAGAAAGQAPARRNAFRPALRIVASLQVAAILMQAVTAGQMLDGDGMKSVHGAGAGAVHLLGVVQVIVALLYWRPGRGTVWAAVASLVLLLAGFTQSAVGGSHNLAVHVPLGVALLGLAIATASWSWMTSGTARPAHA